MYPGSYLTPFPDNYGSYALPGGGHNNDTLSTPLAPFSTDAQGNFYTSSSVQSLGRFGYSYPELQDWNQNPKQLQANVTAQINALYGSSTKTKRNVLWKQAQTKEWSVAISVWKFALANQRFIIRIFLGDIPENPLDWATSDACVGSFPVLPPASRAAHPKHQVPTHNEISLTAGLKARGYDGQDSTVTAQYLEKALQWKVQLVLLPIPILLAG
jgi:tyrosinase